MFVVIKWRHNSASLCWFSLVRRVNTISVAYFPKWNSIFVVINMIGEEFVVCRILSRRLLTKWISVTRLCAQVRMNSMTIDYIRPIWLRIEWSPVIRVSFPNLIILLTFICILALQKSFEVYKKERKKLYWNFARGFCKVRKAMRVAKYNKYFSTF